MTEPTPSHRKRRPPPRECVTTYNTAETIPDDKKPAKSSKSKPSQEDN